MRYTIFCSLPRLKAPSITMILTTQMSTVPRAMEASPVDPLDVVAVEDLVVEVVDSQEEGRSLLNIVVRWRQIM